MIIPPDDLDRLASRMVSGRTTMLTGAGVSAASGVPTFRGADGLWQSFRVEDLATPQAFARDPATVWQWYDWRRGLIAACAPNAAHTTIAEWSRRLPGFTLITQNVDGLHERAGTERVLRLHGSIWELRCWRGCEAALDAWRDDRAPLPVLPPRCPACGGIARPGVVWFGELLDARILARAHEALACDVFLAVGTSAIVYPAASMIPVARASGAFTVEINPEATEASEVVDLSVRGAAETVLPAIEQAVRTRASRGVGKKSR
jgi:NAD-dependent deacetylase